MTPRRRRLVVGLLIGAVVADAAVLAVVPTALALTAQQSKVARVEAIGAAKAARTAEQTAAARGDAGHLQDPSVPKAPERSSAHPTRVVIPAIKVDASLERLHRAPSGELLAPTVADQAGWFADGVVPGDQGPAVIAGHLDNILGPAVFVDLRDLRPGDAIEVVMSNHRTLRFVVTAAHVVRKARFPTADVYGPTPDAQLRLITCNEPFDSEAHGYSDNLVVFATLKP